MTQHSGYPHHLRNLEPKGARLRGRAAVAQRLRRLAAEPLCRHCSAKGIITPSVTPDHKTPLAFGGTDTEDNIQCLCDDCHAIKSAAEGAATGGAANHPHWLNLSAIPLTIVCGPPCAGKTTHIADRAGAGDTVIDLDAIARAISPAYTHWTGRLTSDLLNQAIRARNAMLGSLESQRRGRAWFIVAAPSSAERAWWLSKLGGEVVLLHPGVEECKRRAVARGTPNAVKGVDDWERASRTHWAPKPAARTLSAIGEDGWPTDTRLPSA